MVFPWKITIQILSISGSGLWETERRRFVVGRGRGCGPAVRVDAVRKGNEFTGEKMEWNRFWTKKMGISPPKIWKKWEKICFCFKPKLFSSCFCQPLADDVPSCVAKIQILAKYTLQDGLTTKWRPHDTPCNCLINGGLTWFTLWLCQNSYWKLPFIVSFPIKNGDFP